MRARLLRFGVQIPELPDERWDLGNYGSYAIEIWRADSWASTIRARLLRLGVQIPELLTQFQQSATPTLTPTNRPKVLRFGLQIPELLTQRKFRDLACRFLSFLRSASLFQYRATPTLTPTNRPKLWLYSATPTLTPTNRPKLWLVPRPL